MFLLTRIKLFRQDIIFIVQFWNPLSRSRLPLSARCSAGTRDLFLVGVCSLEKQIWGRSEVDGKHGWGSLPLQQVFLPLHLVKCPLSRPHLPTTALEQKSRVSFVSASYLPFPPLSCVGFFFFFLNPSFPSLTLTWKIHWTIYALIKRYVSVQQQLSLVKLSLTSQLVTHIYPRNSSATVNAGFNNTIHQQAPFSGTLLLFPKWERSLVCISSTSWDLTKHQSEWPQCVF